MSLLVLLFWYKIYIEKGQPGKRVCQKGAYIQYIFLIIDWVVLFWYKIYIEKGQPVQQGFGKRVSVPGAKPPIPRNQ